jgi:hypothetical protein
MNDRRSLLRTSLRGNAAFSTLSGLTFVLGAGPVAEAIGLGEARILATTGVSLLGFGAFLLYTASREAIHLPTALAIVWMDLAWVVGTVPVVALDLLNRTGSLAAIAVADVVLVLALLQYLGVRRLRQGARAPSSSSRSSAPAA